MHAPDLFWLPPRTHNSADLAALKSGMPGWLALCDFARTNTDSIAVRSIDRTLTRLFPEPPPGLTTRPWTLAVLSSSTIDHLIPAIRVGAARRNIWLKVDKVEYGQHAQALMDPNSHLRIAPPEAILFSFDARHILAPVSPCQTVADAEHQVLKIADGLSAQWARARAITRGQIIQQTLLPVFEPILGENESRLPGSRLWALQRLNVELRTRADAEGVDLLSVDTWSARHGRDAWHDPALWHRAKQEIHPATAAFYGDLVGRLLAAAQGLSYKALVLDLDNTLWGGVIGDDGLGGITLGQGSAAGEAFAAFQDYARALGRRGVILAVCSKNDEANAIEVFDKHPEMVLKRDDIACFVANWTDKATNLRSIAKTLNIGLDSLVFVDDNPAERAIIRRELPMVAVPEVPADPTLVPATLAAAGYFEALQVTQDDLTRGRQYQANITRARLVESTTDLEGYLRSLEMEAVWGRFDRASKTRVVQLINKTNQFNLTTRRVTDAEIDALIDDPAALTLQIRLKDRFGDNGIIAVVIGNQQPGTRDIVLNTWLMSCRVLGRGVEQETLNLIIAQARLMNAERVIGIYRPTPKNDMVREHYKRLGFTRVTEDGSRFELDLGTWQPLPTLITPNPPYSHASAAVKDP